MTTTSQGIYIRPTEHWMGVAVPKRSLLFEAVFHVLKQRRPVVATVDRLVGKLGFVRSCHTSSRCLVQDCHAWLQRFRSASGRRPLWPSCWWELFVAAIDPLITAI